MTEVNTAIAPTDRSMPAVRITIDCAQPRMPTTAICCSTKLSVPVRKKLPAASPKIRTDSSRTIIGTADGVWCSQC